MTTSCCVVLSEAGHAATNAFTGSFSSSHSLRGFPPVALAATMLFLSFLSFFGADSRERLQDKNVSLKDLCC